MTRSCSFSWNRRAPVWGVWIEELCWCGCVRWFGMGGGGLDFESGSDPAPQKAPPGGRRGIEHGTQNCTYWEALSWR